MLLVGSPVGFQSTLPRRERHLQEEDACPNIYISIHAPAKGATEEVKNLRNDMQISIHAPAKGATVPTVT